MEDTWGRMDTGSFLLLRVATSCSVRGQIRLLQSTKGLQDQENAKSLPAALLITYKAQDVLPQLVASESLERWRQPERGPLMSSCFI